MSELLNALTQQELLALALEASQRGDTAHAVAYLKTAAARPDALPEALFMLGSEYAQAGLIDDARASMARSIEIAPTYAIARFQLGLLTLTTGDAAGALHILEPLEQLPPEHPQAFLHDFQRGLKHLIADQFAPTVEALEQGIARNAEIEPLNGDMRRVIGTIRGLMDGSVQVTGQAPADAASANTPAAQSVAAAPASSAEASDKEAIHLFITAYTQGGKPH